MGPIADKIGYRTNSCKEMRCASLMLGGNETGASAPESKGRDLTDQRLRVNTLIVHHSCIIRRYYFTLRSHG